MILKLSISNVFRLSFNPKSVIVDQFGRLRPLEASIFKMQATGTIGCSFGSKLWALEAQEGFGGVSKLYGKTFFFIRSALRRRTENLKLPQESS